MMVLIWAFIKKHIAIIISAVGGFLLAWKLLRPSPPKTEAAISVDRTIGALGQKAADEQQQAANVPPTKWSDAAREPIIEELRKDGIIK